MEKLEKVFENKLNALYTTAESDKQIMTFTKGLNNRINSFLMGKLEENGVPTHFIEKLSDTEALVKSGTLFPIDVTVRNLSGYDYAKKYGIAPTTPFNMTPVEFYLRDEELGNPEINQYNCVAIGIANPKQIDTMIDIAFKANDFLCPYLFEAGVVLADMTFTFAALDEENIVLVGEITPDSCTMWDKDTAKPFVNFEENLLAGEGKYADIRKKLLGE